MNKNILILIIVLIIIAGGALAWHLWPSGIDCVIEENYCVYPNVPDYLKFTETKYIENIDTEISPFAGDLTEYLIRSQPGPDGKWLCAPDGSDTVKIKYFSLVRDPDVIGAHHSRRAIVCSDFYFVQDETSYAGTRMYGPFFSE